ncbi:WD40 repeat-like protein [Microstroma glucosiphilum]|uniref:WD40 repeat-like protein n=1 Tax=Pseudomicrostroma glucosiphilum TaxID=1684307 RepID=A0A316U8D7_9BASI|nr:WD40 repeat-like protein [Pseudomicrostroma glucosiphilum]PWN21108.1 WD40 repeat-like protein [Pseudomicrostroma glucosiphilum]
MDLDDAAQEDGLTVDELVASSSLPSSSANTAALLETFENRKLSRSLAVPTNDSDVRLRLRHLGEPTTCFAEAKVDRRERLREALVKERQKRLELRLAKGEEDDEGQEEDVRSESEEEGEQEEEFFTEGTADLLAARRDIAWYSLARAKARIGIQRHEAKASLSTIVGSRRAVFDPLRRFTSLGSQPADERPISVVRFSPDGQQLATGSWSGALKLWNVPSASHRKDFRGHTDKLGGVAWHPRSTLGQSSSAVNLVSGAADNKVCLWSLEKDTPLHILEGHAARVARVAFHPSGNYVASASFDGTWRLWDLEKHKELLLQEGHAKEVYAVEFQGDGALCASGGLDAIGRLWDLRTGRTSMVLDGHAKEILSIDFHPNGYQVATASGDDTVRIWDLRTLSSIYTIPAHQSSVADVRFFKGRDRLKLSTSGMYLATAGYDGLLKIWSADDWQLLRSLSGDNGKVMSCDVHPDGQFLASGDWGRTFKLWGAL